MKNSKNRVSQIDKNAAVEQKTQESEHNFSNKIKFPLWLYPETMAKVERLREADDCRSKSEFIEKAVSFYCGYLDSEKNVNFLVPYVSNVVDAIVRGTEMRLSRNLFKMAVELDKLTHILASDTGIDTETLRELHAMCVDEVRRINGTISFEKAYDFQNNDLI